MRRRQRERRRQGLARAIGAQQGESATFRVRSGDVDRGALGDKRFAQFLEKRERLTGRGADSPEDYRPLMILATPHYLRAEGLTGRRRPIVYRDFPGL